MINDTKVINALQSINDYSARGENSFTYCTGGKEKFSFLFFENLHFTKSCIVNELDHKLVFIPLGFTSKIKVNEYYAINKNDITKIIIRRFSKVFNVFQVRLKTKNNDKISIRFGNKTVGFKNQKEYSEKLLSLFNNLADQLNKPQNS